MPRLLQRMLPSWFTQHQRNSWHDYYTSFTIPSSPDVERFVAGYGEELLQFKPVRSRRHRRYGRPDLPCPAR